MRLLTHVALTTVFPELLMLVRSSDEVLMGFIASRLGLNVGTMISKSVPWPPVWLALATLEDTTAYSGGYIRLHKWQFDRGPAGTGNNAKP